ncbi:uncharacterized membrane protein (DUF106 family) [Spirosoma lacussanchae]|uniref:hypothetical protein n=1 Tax=Spirosoma lacussanchae TaxID=1884249 RepID=UPI0011091944|nr:hypothetical protein [Spirosoma lacussanchae]
MKQLFTTVWNFIRSNSARFVWELVAVALGIGITYLISRFTGQQTLQACQDERAELLRKNATGQAFADSVKWSAVVSEKTQQINRLQNELLYFREKNALDSAAAVTELETMRAINARYKSKTGHR